MKAIIKNHENGDHKNNYKKQEISIKSNRKSY